MSSTEKSFFSRIQGLFDSQYRGRYIEHILVEAANADFSVSRALLGRKVPAGFWWVAEYAFAARGGKKRIADMALLDTSTGQPAAFVELKYDDHRNPGNHAQLADYAWFRKKHNIELILLTKYALDAATPSSGIKTLRFDELATRLQVIRKASPVAGLLADYFQEQGLVMQTIEAIPLGRLMARLFNPRDGMGKQQGNHSMVHEIPAVFSALMGNMEIISREISQKTGAKRTAIDFSLVPSISSSVTKLIDEDVSKKKPVRIEQKYKSGGELYVFARQTINQAVSSKKQDSDLYLEYGYCIEIKRGKGSAEPLFYAGIYWKSPAKGEGWDYEFEYRKASCPSMSDKAKASKALPSLIRSVVVEVKKQGLSKSQLSRLATLSAAVR